MFVSFIIQLFAVLMLFASTCGTCLFLQKGETVPCVSFAGVAIVAFLFVIIYRKHRKRVKDKRLREKMKVLHKSEKQEAWNDFLKETIENEIAPTMLRDVFTCCACSKDLPIHHALAFAYTYEHEDDGDGYFFHDYNFDGILCKDCLASIRKMKSLNVTKYFFIPKEFRRIDPDAPVKKIRRAKTP